MTVDHSPHQVSAVVGAEMTAGANGGVSRLHAWPITTISSVVNL